MHNIPRFHLHTADRPPVRRCPRSVPWCSDVSGERRLAQRGCELLRSPRFALVLYGSTWAGHETRMREPRDGVLVEVIVVSKSRYSDVARGDTRAAHQLQ